jgi:hypothetical protein
MVSKPRLSIFLAVFALLGLLLGAGLDSLASKSASATAAAAITTDKTKYEVGEPMTITGVGFAPNGAVTISVLRPDKLTDTLAITANASGGFSKVYQPPMRPGRYKITATDGTNSANTAVTEADAVATDINQCQNGGVGDPLKACSETPAQTGYGYEVNANANSSNSHWTEGDFVPLRIVGTGYSPGAGNIQFSIDVTKSGKHAYDYVGSFDATETTGASTASHANHNNPCGDIFTGCNPDAPDGSGAIPVDASLAAGLYPATCGSNTWSDGAQPTGHTIDAWGVTGVVVTYVSRNVGSNDCVTTIQVAWADTTPGFGGNVVIAYGAHIATQADWGAGNSAISIPGSPYHSSLVARTTGGDTKGIGNQDAKLAASAIVLPDSPTMTTQLHDASHNVIAVNTALSLGSVIHDQATLDNTGGSWGTPQGNVTFYFFNTGTTACPTTGTTGGTAKGTIAVDGSGIAHPSTDTGALAAGSYAFKAVYTSSDAAKWNNAESACEPFTVGKAQLGINTTVHSDSPDAALVGSLPLGGGAHDSATVTGKVGSLALPDVTFYFFGNGVTCTNGSTAGGTVLNTLTPDGSGVAHPSTSQTSLAAGSYNFMAVVASNTNYTGATGDCEPFTVGKAQLGINTTVHSDSPDAALVGSLPLGGGAHDSATVTGKVGSLALPDVTFYFFDDGVTCTNGSTAGGTVLNTLTPNGSGIAHPSTSQTNLAAGSYNFMAVVASNTNYTGATGDCEPFTVSKANTTTVTQIHDADHNVVTSVPLGTTVHDRAVVATKVDGRDITGDVTFTWYTTIDCTTPTGHPSTAAGVVTLVGADLGVAHPSTAFGPLSAGSYSFKAVYAGNDDYNGSTGDCEPLTVRKARLSITTDIHDADHSSITSALVGSVVHDTASVTGQVGTFTPTGAVTFTFDMAPSECGTSPISTAGSSDVGNGNPRSVDTGALAAGSYAFQAAVAGDDNYFGATSACEPLVINKIEGITLSTELHNSDETVIADGGAATTASVHDKATIDYGTGPAPTGDVTFTFWTNGSCDGAGTAAGTVTLVAADAGVAHPSSTKGPLDSGNYSFMASYAGDANYLGPVLSPCEPFTVSKIIIEKVTKPVNTGSFQFTTTGGGYNGFTLTGGQQNSQILVPGSYTAQEGSQLGWVLTGIGGSTDPNKPYDCIVTGSGGSTGSGDLNTETVSVELKAGDTVKCVFENTGQGVTRTQGFWATHPQLAEIAWFGGTAFGHTFPGVAGVTGIGDRTLCGRSIDSLGKLMGGFWSDVSKTSTGAKRSALDQARMQLLQQLLAAELNASAFGSVPSGGTGMFAQWESAYCGNNQNAIKNAQQQAASFNTNGDSGTFTPGTSADSKNARAIANKLFWDVLP